MSDVLPRITSNKASADPRLPTKADKRNKAYFLPTINHSSPVKVTSNKHSKRRHNKEPESLKPIVGSKPNVSINTLEEMARSITDREITGSDSQTEPNSGKSNGRSRDILNPVKSPKSLASKHGINSLDLNYILNEAGINSASVRADRITESNLVTEPLKQVRQGSRLQDSMQPIKINSEPISTTSHNRRTSKSIYIEPTQSDSEIFNLTGNGIVAQYQHFMSYCNQGELDKQVRIANMKDKFQHDRYKIQQPYRIDIENSNSLNISWKAPAASFSTKTNELKEKLNKIHIKNQQSRHKMLKLNDISCDNRTLKEGSRTDMFQEASFLIGRSKIQPDIDIDLSFPVIDRTYDNSSNLVDYTAVNTTFERIFKVNELVKNDTKCIETHIRMKSKQRNKLEAQIDAQKDVLRPAVDNAMHRLNERTMKKTNMDKLAELKGMAKYIEEEIDTQNSRIEGLIHKFVDDFEIPV